MPSKTTTKAAPAQKIVEATSAAVTDTWGRRACVQYLQTHGAYSGHSRDGLPQLRTLCAELLARPEPVEPTGTSAADQPQPNVAAGPARRERGALLALVRGWMEAHPNPDGHKPHDIDKALQHGNSGAIGNALERMVRNGDAVKVAQKPRRYALAAQVSSAA